MHASIESHSRQSGEVTEMNYYTQQTFFKKPILLRIENNNIFFAYFILIIKESQTVSIEIKDI